MRSRFLPSIDLSHRAARSSAARGQATRHSPIARREPQTRVGRFLGRLRPSLVAPSPKTQLRRSGLENRFSTVHLPPRVGFDWAGNPARALRVHALHVFQGSAESFLFISFDSLRSPRAIAAGEHFGGNS